MKKKTQTSVPTYIRHWRVLANEMVPMRDGVRLATTVYLPPAAGRYPAVLVRTAYNRHMGDLGFAGQGVAVVTQDCRGRYGSGGSFYPFINETRDGQDTLSWIARQPWSNGRVGMLGASYLAGTQFAVAPLRDRRLVALNPQFMSGDLWRQAYYSNGAFSLALTFSWLALEVGGRTSDASLTPVYDQGPFLRELPLLTLDEKYGVRSRSYRDMVRHYRDDAYWKSMDFRRQLGRSRVPFLFTSGWYDYYPGEGFRNYRALLDSSAPTALKRSHRVIVGPYTHGFLGGNACLGQVNFGPDALKENDAPNRWLLCLLKGRRAADFMRAPIRLFVMGVNRWRDEYEWPLRRTRFARFYLRSGGRANSLLGDGALVTKPPTDESVDRYAYDPANPVPTLGGNHSVGPYNPGLYEICLPGPYDQRPIERRDDVLVYTSEPLSADLEITGPVVVKLYAATSARDTDFVARLTDVHPDGRSINLTEGILRARFRGGRYRNPRLVPPGAVQEYEIELQPTSNVFFKGHSIRLDITSSGFPLWAPNLNTGANHATGTRMVVAEQTIHHSRRFASHVVLPVIPAGTGRKE